MPAAIGSRSQRLTPSNTANPMTSSLDSRAAAVRELQVIPGVGPIIARNLVALGISRVAQLRGKNPERLYRRLEAHEGAHVDRCALYVLRCAVYYAENQRHDPRLLKWWNWKDDRVGPHHRRRP